MQHNPHEIKHLKYISLLNIRILRLIFDNKLDRAKHLQDFKETLKKYPLLKPLNNGKK